MGCSKLLRGDSANSDGISLIFMVGNGRCIACYFRTWKCTVVVRAMEATLLAWSSEHNNDITLKIYAADGLPLEGGRTAAAKGQLKIFEGPVVRRPIMGQLPLCLGVYRMLLFTHDVLSILR
jgi:hypothetical protein